MNSEVAHTYKSTANLSYFPRSRIAQRIAKNNMQVMERGKSQLVSLFYHRIFLIPTWCRGVIECYTCSKFILGIGRFDKQMRFKL